jgi:hypothetical protein
MEERGKPHFTEAELEDLRCIIRITIEFSHFLESDGSRSAQRNVRYISESVFSGVDSFCSVSAALRPMADVTTTELQLAEINSTCLRQVFVSTYRNFLAEGNFEKQCRLLLNLFKMQIVFAGLYYD